MSNDQWKSSKSATRPISQLMESISRAQYNYNISVVTTAYYNGTVKLCVRGCIDQGVTN